MPERSKASVAPRRRFHGAGVAGIVTTGVSSTAIDQVLHTTGVYPGWGARMADALFLIALAHRLVCNAAGGYVAARIGTPRTARTLGVVGTVLATIGLAVSVKMGPEMGPLWYRSLSWLPRSRRPSSAAGCAHASFCRERRETQVVERVRR
jgi:hypothetical protein